MTKRPNILAKNSLRDGLVSSWGELRFGNSSNQQEKQIDRRRISLETPRPATTHRHNSLMHSKLPPPTHHTHHPSSILSTHAKVRGKATYCRSMN